MDERYFNFTCVATDKDVLMSYSGEIVNGEKVTCMNQEKCPNTQLGANPKCSGKALLNKVRANPEGDLIFYANPIPIE